MEIGQIDFQGMQTFHLKGVDGGDLLLKLDEKGNMLHQQVLHNTGSTAPSHVLVAIGTENGIFTRIS